MSITLRLSAAIYWGLPLSSSDLAHILKAARFAAERHSAQRRKGPDHEPYVNHVIDVAALLAELLPGPDPALIMAAFLHDTVEDVGVTPAELERLFGADVAGLVLEVTDDKHLDKPDRKRLQIENAPKKSPRAQALGAADKICNLKSILENPPLLWSLSRKREYFQWAKQVVDGYPNLEPALRAEFDRVYRRMP
jgi:GTP diphosphokinase / guanosine-3',5'-bis(diphosphate) 3'-diphosphatase